jgi:hypothetical protein
MFSHSVKEADLAIFRIVSACLELSAKPREIAGNMQLVEFVPFCKGLRQGV